jgi:hypothetical protein
MIDQLTSAGVIVLEVESNQRIQAKIQQPADSAVEPAVVECKSQKSYQNWWPTER